MSITLVDVVLFFAGGGDTYCTRYFEIASVTDADDTDDGVTVQLTEEVELDACSGDGELLLTGINEIASELWEK